MMALLEDRFGEGPFLAASNIIPERAVHLVAIDAIPWRSVGTSFRFLIERNKPMY